ncbi:MAG: PAS domain S-box protein [Candidatus Acidiferrum sp.]
MARIRDDPGADLNVRSLPREAPAASEQRFRGVVEALPDAIIIQSKNKIVFVNRNCVRLLSANGPEHLLGRDIFEIVTSESWAAIKSRMRARFSTGKASPPMECILIGCDGSSVPVEAVAIPISWNGSPAIEVVARDIRQRKRVEREAQDWQKRLELAQRSGLGIGLWDWDLQSNTVIWSDETYRQFGFTRDLFSGKVEDAVTRLHPEDRPRVEKAIQKARAEKAAYAARYRVVRPDGSTRWVDAHGVIVRDGSVHMLGVGVDITDLKKTEERLLESEEKYLLLLNSTAGAIFGLNLEGNCTFCNPASVRLLGYEGPGNLLGGRMHALIHHTRADGTPYPEQECEIYRAVREGRASHVTDEVLWRRDGTSFMSEYWSYPLYTGGKLVGAVVTFLDISDRKRAELALRHSEEKFRNLFENATYGIFISKPDGSLLDANPAFVAMLGYGSREELLKQNLDRDIYQDPADRKAILDKYEPGGRVDGVEAKWRRRDGKSITVRMSGGAVRGENGSFSHFEVIVEDVTERRSLEDQLRQAQKMEVVGLLAGGISHDFNNLLNVILGNAELLLENTESRELQHHGEEIKKATQRAAQLTRQLLAFSRKQVLSLAVLDANAVLHDVAQILRRLIGENIQVVMNLDPALASIRADRGQIEQILMNLATNARDAMPNGGQFTIRSKNSELGPADVARYPYVKPGQYVCLTVSDTGMGMSEEIRGRVFEPFFTTKPQGRGTGLGLATVYGIVKQSAGYIWFTSVPEAGTTFEIFLPRVEGKAPALVPVSELRNDYPRGNETVLLVEDEEPLRQVMCEFLTASGYKVLQAGCGQDAINMVTQYKESISLIISDVVLPDISGPWAVAEMQALHPETRALYVSGYTEVPMAQKLVAKGVILLQKPVSQTDLLRTVDEMLHLPAASTKLSQFSRPLGKEI